MNSAEKGTSTGMSEADNLKKRLDFYRPAVCRGYGEGKRLCDHCRRGPCPDRDTKVDIRCGAFVQKGVKCIGCRTGCTSFYVKEARA